MEPKKPTTIPIILCLLTLVLKNKKPMMIVNKGVSAFRTPVKELAKPVSALANKNAGIRLPIAPVMSNSFNCLADNLRNLGNAMGINTNPAQVILMAPTSSGEKTTKPRLISRKENPHTIERDMSIIHAVVLFSLLSLIFKWGKSR